MIATAAVASEVAAKLFRGLGDPTRLAILLALLAGERRVTDLVGEFGAPQSTVSSHLSCLKGCGLVTSRPEGRQVFYSLASVEVMGLLRAAETLLEDVGAAVDLCPRYLRGKVGSSSQGTSELGPRRGSVQDPEAHGRTSGITSMTTR